MYYRQKNPRNLLIAAGIITSLLAGILLAIWLIMFSFAAEPSDQVGEASPQPSRTATPDARPRPNKTATSLPYGTAAGTITQPDTRPQPNRPATPDARPQPTPTPEPRGEPTATPETERTFYVSKDGDNTDGLAWATAWNELDQIDWDSIRPGDTILLDGGASEMHYTSTLEVGASGTQDKPITIKLASEEGRNGQVVIFGGRSEPLPFCGQRKYEYQKRNVREVGLLIEDTDWVVLDGMKWRGIAIHGHNGTGVRITSDASDITLRNMLIYDNGTAYREQGRWYPTRYGVSQGITLSGTNITVERAIIHDNGSDAIQSGGGVHNFTLRQSWLYNARTLPNDDEIFNRCTHQDGIQIHNGGEQSGITIEDSIIGPGLLQGVLLGAPGRAVINDVTIRHTLFYKTDNANIHSQDTEPKNWTIEHITSYRDPGAEWNNIVLSGEDHIIRNSIFYGGRAITVPNKGVVVEENCQWKVPEGNVVGEEVDPEFADIASGDFALRSDSSCTGKGARITSVDELIDQSMSTSTLAPNVPFASPSTLPRVLFHALLYHRSTSWLLP